MAEPSQALDLPALEPRERLALRAVARLADDLAWPLATQKLAQLAVSAELEPLLPVALRGAPEPSQEACPLPGLQSASLPQVAGQLQGLRDAPPGEPEALRLAWLLAWPSRQRSGLAFPLPPQPRRLPGRGSACEPSPPGHALTSSSAFSFQKYRSQAGIQSTPLP